MKKTLFQIVTAIMMLVSSILVGSPPAFAAMQTWTQTTLSDFSGGTLYQTQASIWNPGDPADDGNVILQSQTLDQTNWGPAYAPSTPAIYGTQYEGQTFRPGRSGSSLIFTLYLIKAGNPQDLVVEFRNATTNDSSTAQPGGTVLGSRVISASNITESGNMADVQIQLPSPFTANNMYSLAIHQSGNGGTSKDYYKWWYGDNYPDGQGWKTTSISSGWEGNGFGSHDSVFRMYVGDSETKSYSSSGNFISSVFDATANTTYGTISWSDIINPGTAVKFQVAVSNDTSLPWSFLGPDGTSSTYYEVSGTNIWVGTANNRYIRYKSFLSTNSTEATPVLASVSITYNVINPPVLDRIVISPKTATIVAGSSQVYTAQAFDQFNNNMGDVTATATFSIQSGAGGTWSSNNYTSQNAGVWTVTATDNGKTDSATLNVTAAQMTSFAFAPISSPQLTATPFSVSIKALDKYGNTVTSFTGTASLSDNSSSILPTVTGSFLGGVWTDNVSISSVWAGDNITATSGTITGTSNSFDVLSSIPALDRIVISPKTATIVAGSSQAYTVEAFDQFNNSMGDVTAATTFSIQSGAGGTWSANNYTSQYAGTWTVTVTNNGKTDSATLTVNAGQIMSFAFGPISSPQLTDTPFAVTIKAVDQYGNTVTSFNGTAEMCAVNGISPSITGAFSAGVWTGNATISNICSNDFISANAGNITGTSNNFDVLSSIPAVDRIVISPKTATIVAGSSQAYTIEAFDQFNDSMGDFTATTTFSIQSGASGTWDTNNYTSQNAGNWTVTATYNGKSDTATLTVDAGQMTSFAFEAVSSPQTAGVLFPVTIKAVDQSGNTITSFTDSANLSDLSGTISPVDTGAFLAGVWTGNLAIDSAWNNNTINATRGAVSGTSGAFNVIASPVVGHIVISPKTATVVAGNKQAYTVEGVDQFDNNMGDVSATTIFSIQSGAGGTWSGNNYTSQYAGVWTVIATNNGKTDSASLTVSSGSGFGGGGGVGGGGVGGGGGGGGALPKVATVSTANFTVDFLGRVTTVPMSSDGRIGQNITASDPSDNQTLEIAAGTKVTDDQGNVVDLITIREMTSLPIPENSFIVGKAYDFSPSNASFDQAIRITLSYTAGSLPENVSSIAIAYYAQSGWQELQPVVSESGKLTVPTTHLSVYALLARVKPEVVAVVLVAPVANVIPPKPVVREPIPAQFVFSDLRIERSYLQRWNWLPIFVRVGSDASVSVSIENTGEESGASQVTLKVNGQTIGTQSLELPAGRIGQVSFTLPHNTPGVYTVEVANLNGTFESYTRINWWLIGGIVAGAAALAWLSWYLNRRRQLRRAKQIV